jgi:DNA-binding NarL/FixJ family response regulator
VLCDLRLGDGMDGVATTAPLRALPGPARVLILTTFDHDAQIVRAVEAGAAGPLGGGSRRHLPGDRRHRGQRPACHPGQRRAPRGRAARCRVELTAREQEVLALVAEAPQPRDRGAPVVAEATVKTHIVHLLDKLAADSRTRAVSEARRRGLL